MRPCHCPLPEHVSSCRKLRTSLLDDAEERVKAELRVWYAALPDTGCTICIDGWSDAQRRPLLNVMAVNPQVCAAG